MKIPFYWLTGQLAYMMRDVCPLGIENILGAPNQSIYQSFNLQYESHICRID